MGAGGSRLFPEPVGWGRGTWLVVRVLCLAGSSSHTHYFMPCHQRLPIPTHSSRQHPNNQPPCFLPRVADCQPDTGTPGKDEKSPSFVLCS